MGHVRLLSGGTLLALAMGLCLSFATTPAKAQGTPTILFILDASNSMWGQVQGRAKMEIAREVLSRLIGDLPPEVSVGLEAYGHRRDKDCGDIETLALPGTQSREAILGRIEALSPRGKTPLTAALQKAADDLKPIDPEGSVVLVSDGVESCGGDPCALVKSLRQGGMKIVTHVVGFDVAGEGDKAQLACIAEAGGGRYFTALDADQLRGALVVVQESIIEKARVEGETLWLDTYDAGSKGFAGPAVSREGLEAGVKYILTVKGTFSSWAAGQSETTCNGTAEGRPNFPSPSTVNGQTNRDGGFLFAVPSSWSPGCGMTLPTPSPAFEASLDNGQTWAGLTPLETDFQPSHTYTYEVTGQGFPLQVRHPDSPTSDNYGQLMFLIQKIAR